MLSLQPAAPTQPEPFCWYQFLPHRVNCQLEKFQCGRAYEDMSFSPAFLFFIINKVGANVTILAVTLSFRRAIMDKKERQPTFLTKDALDY